jgi:hypothetical protein
VQRVASCGDSLHEKVSQILLQIPAECIKNEIEENVENSNWAIGSVEEYRFQFKTVYAFLPDDKIIADASTQIKDSDCQLLCQVGGFGGPGVNICNGDNFYQSATLVRVIWKKR